MDRLERALLIAVFALMGVLLTTIALFGTQWDNTLPMLLFPARSIFRHGAVRGFVVALGLLDLLAAAATARDTLRATGNTRR